jgi:DNA-binding transcriptional ArsR family regulator
MAQVTSDIQTMFRALADPTRRAIVERLVKGPASVSHLAKPFEIALPSFVQHLKVLERAGLVRSRKSGRVRFYGLVVHRLRVAENWLIQQREAEERRRSSARSGPSAAA